VSEHDEPGRGELERRLDAAFQGTRPRRGFEDELWARLQARRPWWRRLGDGLERVPLAGVATGLAALLLVGLVVTLVRLSLPHGPSMGASTAAVPAAVPAASGVSRGGSAAGTALPFGPLPAPPAGGATVLRPSGPSGLPAESQGANAQGASVPPPPPELAVYKYDPASGPANGTILETGALPGGLSMGLYPSRPAADAVAAAEAGQASGRPVVLTQARLVYVAVVSGGVGFLEPAYLFTGTVGGAPAQVLVSALAPFALR
jgi:hypothetical protein